ncbi:sterol desaturase family protein [Baekduia soli]|nr:sterol desaturase family protein [Baekduia soli]
MFQSRLLDRFTRVHPAVPPALFGPVISYMLVEGVSREGVLNSVGLALAGYLTWTLFEYWLHRVVFHFEPDHGVGARLHWMIHGVHHDHPNDPLRLVMPPSVSVPLAAALLWAFWGIMGYDAALVFGGSFLAGYLAYDMLHYHVHHHTPRTAMGRRLRELHMRHHFQDDERGFGISAPYWDTIFGTAPARTGNRSVAGGTPALDGAMRSDGPGASRPAPGSGILAGRDGPR